MRRAARSTAPGVSGKLAWRRRSRCLRAQSAAADSDRFCISIPSAAAEAHSHSQGPGWRCGFWRLATDGSHLPLEPVQIVADGHGEGEQFFERVLWLLKGDGDATWLDSHPCREILELLGQDLKRSLDEEAGPFPTILLPLGQNIRKAATATVLIVSFIAFRQALQVGDEGIAIGEAARADPFGNTGSQDLLRAPSAHAKQKFEGGAIDVNGSGIGVTRGLRNTTRSPERPAWNDARARCLSVHLTGSPCGLGVLASSAAVKTAATCGSAR